MLPRQALQVTLHLPSFTPSQSFTLQAKEVHGAAVQGDTVGDPFKAGFAFHCSFEKGDRSKVETETEETHAIEVIP